jgi:hypothetical protein
MRLLNLQSRSGERLSQIPDMDDAEADIRAGKETSRIRPKDADKIFGDS